MVTSAEKFWDRTAARYAKSPVSDDAAYQKKIAETQQFLDPTMRVLEFGCGTGTTALQHAPYVAHIDATDISANMLEIGRAKAKEAGVENVTFSHGTLSEIGAANASYDAVLGLNVLHLLADRADVIEAVARILKPDGVFVSSTACVGESYLRFIKLINPLGKLLGLMPDVYVMTEAELVDDIVNSGFAIERQWRHGKDGIAIFIIARKR